jgi:hypothetical protein
MASKKRKTPSILLLILSTLGILFGGIITVLSLVGSLFFTPESTSAPDFLSGLTTSFLSFTICLLNIPTFCTSIKNLKQINSQHSLPGLFGFTNYLITIWPLIVLAGYLASQNEFSTIFLAPLTIIAIAVPVWWLVEFSRRGLPRSTKLREWGTLSIGITLTPILIILIELIVVAIVTIIVLIGLGFQENFNFHFSSLLNNINPFQSEIGELDQILYDLMEYPIVSTGLFLVVGFLAPLIEEIFKPFAIWFLLKRPLRNYEGFSLGLISGGAFTLLESAGMILQLNASDWLAAVLLRAATGVLHIGLSGLVGFGVTRNWNRKRYGKGVLYILAAVLLHGVWNSLALLSGYSSILSQNSLIFVNSGIIDIFVLVSMIAVFLLIITINLKINAHLQHQLTKQEP